MTVRTFYSSSFQELIFSFSRYDGPLNSMIRDGLIIRSVIDSAMTGSSNSFFQPLGSTWEVTISTPFRYRSSNRSSMMPASSCVYSLSAKSSITSTLVRVMRLIHPKYFPAVFSDCASSRIKFTEPNWTLNPAKQSFFPSAMDKWVLPVPVDPVMSKFS